MKLKQKRIISLFLAALMLFSVLSTGTMTASAATISLNRPLDKAYVITAREYYSDGTHHCAIDYGCPKGTPVYAAESGTVTVHDGGYGDGYYGNTSANGGWGNYIIIAHANNYYTRYAHMSTGRFVVKTGTKVKRGQLIGYSGNSGNTSGPHLHFGLYLNGLNKNNRVYPEPYIKTATGYNSGGPHVCSFSGSYFEAAHPHKVYQKCSCGKTKYTGATRAYQKCSTCMKLNQGYVQPVKAYTINTGKTTVYNAVNGTAKSNKIYDTDLCTISQIYDCGWCKVTFPLDAGGTDTGYCKISVFMKGGGYYLYTSKQINTYRRSDLKTSNGYAGTGDKIYILGVSGSAVQIAYPLTAGGWKVGWIPTSAIKCTVSYNANGGTGSMPNSSVQYNSKFTLTANKFTKTGYTFSGWNVYRRSDKKWYVAGEGWKTASEISSKGYNKKLYSDKWSGSLSQAWTLYGKTNDTFTFYAVWTPNKLSVNYNANGGTISSDTYKLSNNIVYKKSDNKKLTQTWIYNAAQKNGLYNASSFGLTRNGYTFKGWGTTASGGTVFDQNDAALVPSKINANIKNGSCATTLYAIWEKKENPVTHTHKWNTDYTIDKEPTCTETGLKSIHCADCNAVKDSQVIPANGHKLGEYKVAENATCTETGLEKSVCSNCNYSETRVINALGHDYSDKFTVDKKATCTENGEKSKHCSRCDSKIDVTAIPLADHSYGEWTVVTSNTCTEKGTQIRVCTVCDNIKISEIPATGHSYETVVIEPTPFEKGFTLYTCSQCGYSYKDNYVDVIRILGDVDLDGDLTVKDATLIQEYIVELKPLSDLQKKIANVNGDSDINVMDATYIQMVIAELIKI